MKRTGFIVALTASLTATACGAASREYDACLFLSKKYAYAPDTVEVVDSTDFTAIGKPIVELSIKARGAAKDDVRASIRCTYSSSGDKPLTLISFEVDDGKWSGDNADKWRDYLKVGGF